MWPKHSKYAVGFIVALFQEKTQKETPGTSFWSARWSLWHRLELQCGIQRAFVRGLYLNRDKGLPGAGPGEGGPAMGE